MSRSKQQQTWDRWIAKKERAAYLRGLKDAKAFCDMARSGLAGLDGPKDADRVASALKGLSEHLARLERLARENDSAQQH